MGTGPSRHVDAIQKEPCLQWKRTTGTSHQHPTVYAPQDPEEHKVLWVDALAALYSELEELKRQTRVKQTENGVRTKVKQLLHLNPHQKQDESHCATESQLITVDHIADVSPGAGSLQIDEPAMAETKMPKRSSSLGKCQGGRSVGSQNSSSIAPEITPVSFLSVSEEEEEEVPKRITVASAHGCKTSKQSTLTHRAQARITTATYTCISPGGTAVTSVQNSSIPSSVGLEDNHVPSSTMSTDSKATTAGTSMGAGGSGESILTCHLPRKVVTSSAPSGKHGHVCAPSLRIPTPGFGVNKRHKYGQRSRRHLHNISISTVASLPAEVIDKGEHEAKSRDEPGDIGENTSHKGISRHSTSAYKKESRNRKVKVPRTTCPPEILYALVYLDGPLPYSQDTENIEEYR